MEDVVREKVWTSERPPLKYLFSFTQQPILEHLNYRVSKESHKVVHKKINSFYYRRAIIFWRI